MSNLLDDWQDFCEGRKDFDMSHFYTLFHADPTILSNEQLKIIFSYFPKSDELLYRMENIFNERFSSDTDQNPENNIGLSDAQLKELVLNDIKEKRIICETKKDAELCEIIAGVEPVIVTDIQKIKALQQCDGPDAWMKELVDDHLRSARITNDKKVISLFEAFYGLTTNYQLVWYAGLPLINDNYDPSYYFELWKFDCDYVLTKDELLIACAKNKNVVT
jgi:hypothetical protein